MTAVPPAPVVIIDRSFAEAPPACVRDITPLQFDDGISWASLSEKAVRDLVKRGNCLGQIQGWIQTEEATRMINQELGK